MGLDSLENTTKVFGTRPKPFRLWLQEKWYDHVDECNLWKTTPCGNVKEYFNKYKWWLKREYLFQKGKN